MSVFKNISEKYGRENLKIARDLEAVAKKQVATTWYFHSGVNSSASRR